MHDPYTVLWTQAQGARFNNKCYPRTGPTSQPCHKSGRHRGRSASQRTTTHTPQTLGAATRIHTGRAGIASRPRVGIQPPAGTIPSTFVLLGTVGTSSYSWWTCTLIRCAIHTSRGLPLEHCAPLFKFARVHPRPQCVAYHVFPSDASRRACTSTTPVIMDRRQFIALRVWCWLQLSRVSRARQSFQQRLRVVFGAQR